MVHTFKWKINVPHLSMSYVKHQLKALGTVKIANSPCWCQSCCQGYRSHCPQFHHRTGYGKRCVTHKLKPTINNIVLTFLHQTLTTHIDVKENPKILNTKLHNEPQVFTLNKCLNSDYHTAGEFARKNLWRIYHNTIFGKRKVWWICY